MDKSNGHLAVSKVDLLDKDVVKRIKHVKAMIELDTIPEPCYDLVPDGKSGNTKLAMECSYCVFKQHCFPKQRFPQHIPKRKHMIIINIFDLLGILAKGKE